MDTGDYIALSALLFSLFSLFMTTKWSSFKFYARLSRVKYLVNENPTQTTRGISRKRFFEYIISSYGNKSVYVDSLIIKDSLDSSKSKNFLINTCLDAGKIENISIDVC